MCEEENWPCLALCCTCMPAMCRTAMLSLPIHACSLKWPAQGCCSWQPMHSWHMLDTGSLLLSLGWRFRGQGLGERAYLSTELARRPLVRLEAPRGSTDAETSAGPRAKSGAAPGAAAHSLPNGGAAAPGSGGATPDHGSTEPGTPAPDPAAAGLRVRLRAAQGAAREPATADSSFYSPDSSAAGSPFARAPLLWSLSCFIICSYWCWPRTAASSGEYLQNLRSSW